jgi:hypothetical protein
LTDNTIFGKMPNKLKSAAVNVLSYDYCHQNSMIEEKDLNQDVEFCAGIPDKNGDMLTEKGTDSCQGENL